jgi:hypothetical protein
MIQLIVGSFFILFSFLVIRKGLQSQIVIEKLNNARNEKDINNVKLITKELNKNLFFILIYMLLFVIMSLVVGYIFRKM